MAILPVYNSYHPVMKKKTEEIENIDDDLKQLVNNMFETMYKADGIGLAANQVGISKSLLIVDVSQSEDYKDESPLVMINPKIITLSDEEVDYTEGCLSVPLFYEKIERPQIIEVSYFDLDMREHKIEANELLSRVIQHEYDHLNGVLFYERLSAIKKTLAKNKLKKIQRGKVISHYTMINANGELVRPE